MIRCQNVTIGYTGHTVLEHLNFSVKKGDYLCIIGENGTGKSTLMKTILGLLPPISGEITLLSQKDVGYLPQQIERQKDFPATVAEIVQSGCLSRCGMRPFYNKEEKQRAKYAMERLGLTPLAKRCYRELSGGQQERVLLARAFCCSDHLLLLDEPTAGLDPKITQELYTILGDLHKNEQVTVVMISHDLSATMTYATHILCLGKDSFFGTKEEYTQWERHCNLCDPPT